MERKAGKWVIKSQQMEKDSRLLTVSEVVRTESAHTLVLLFCLATAVWHLAESNGKNRESLQVMLDTYLATGWHLS